MEWIDVRDMLPEPGQDVIYHAPGIFTTGIQMWFGKYDGNGTFYSRSGFLGGGEVTHWMPIPKTPDTNFYEMNEIDKKQSNRYKEKT